MKKLFEMALRASSFFGPEDRNEESEKVVRDLFNLDATADLDTTTVTLNLRIEDFLWSLFTQVPQPASPLKLAAHKRKLDKIAEQLNETLSTDTLPRLGKDLELIKPLIDDEASFAKVTVPFNAVPVNPRDEMKAIPLPALNVLRDIEFVSTLDKMFDDSAT